MADKARKAAKLKLIMGITIPVFIMITSLIMVGVSFAWFSTSATTNIATINLTTTKVFTLSFSAGESEDTSYNGQTALGRDNYLISLYREYNSEQLENYYENSPFMFKTSIGLSTEGIPVDLDMDFKITQITYENGYVGEDGHFHGDGNPYDLDIYGASSETKALYPSVHEYDADKIPYAFTWFFVERNVTFENASVIYSPYGKINLSSHAGSVVTDKNYRYATALNGVSVTSTTSIANAEHGIKNFVANKDQFGENQIFDFYVVFAPEKLFWMQFFEADRNKLSTQVYTETELRSYIARGETLADCNKMYYSATTYIGALFNFTAEVNVTDVHWPVTP